MCIVQPVFPHHAKYDSISPKGQEVLHMRAVEGSHLSHTEILPLRHQPLHAGQYGNLCSVMGRKEPGPDHDFGTFCGWHKSSHCGCAVSKKSATALSC